MLWMLIGFLVSVLLLLMAAGGLLRHVLRERQRTAAAVKAGEAFGGEEKSVEKSLQ